MELKAQSGTVVLSEVISVKGDGSRQENYDCVLMPSRLRRKPQGLVKLKTYLHSSAFKLGQSFAAVRYKDALDTIQG